MAFQAFVVVLGVIVGWVRGGTLRALANVRLKWIWLLPTAYVAQYVAVYNLRGWLYEVIIVTSYLALMVFCLFNRRVRGVTWALLGILANFVVMIFNGLRMPAYLPAVAKVAPQLIPLLAAGRVGKSIAMSSQTHLNFLGDIFCIQVGFPTLVSIGDLIFSAGLIIFIMDGMLEKGGEQIESTCR